MKPQHREIAEEIQSRLERIESNRQPPRQKYRVTLGRKENSLPNADKHLYEPDVIVRDKNDKQVLKIVEIEGDPVRKSIVGAAILADYCIKELKQAFKPELYFVIYDEKGIRQLKDFKARVEVIKSYIRYVKFEESHIGTPGEIFRALK